MTLGRGVPNPAARASVSSQFGLRKRIALVLARVAAIAAGVDKRTLLLAFLRRRSGGEGRVCGLSVPTWAVHELTRSHRPGRRFRALGSCCMSGVSVVKRLGCWSLALDPAAP